MEKTGKNRGHNIVVATLIVLSLMVSPLTLTLFKTNFSIGGAAQFYAIEFLVVFLGVYVIIWELLIKKKWPKISVLSKKMLLVAIVFGTYYVATLIGRYLLGTLSTGSFFLARIVIESIVIFIALDYFKVTKKTILDSLVVVLILTTIWQYGNIFLGSGFLRGSNPVLTSTYVYVIYCNTVHVILAYYYFSTSQLKKKSWLVSIYLFNFPTILLTGSRVGVVTTLFVIALLILFSSKKRSIWQRLRDILVMTLLVFVCFAGTIVLASSENKGIVLRSMSIPLSIVKKITPTSIDNKIDELLTFKVDDSKIKDIKTEKKYNDSSDYVNDTIEVSGNQRKEANQKAYDMIFKSPQNFLFGTGTGMIHRYGNTYQKPHNYFAQYTLSFGIIGFLLTCVLYFMPLVYQLKRNFQQFTLLAVILFPIILNSFLQPALGTIVVLYVYMMLLFSFSLGEPDEK